MAGDQTVIIKKVKKGGDHGHHGGAWKVAYADFVTAMMAFFLLMWLINTTTPEQKRGIADYFAPASVSPSTSGSGGILGGTALGEDGAQSRGSSAVIERLSPDAQRDTPSDDQVQPDPATPSSASDISADAMANAMANRENAEFESAEQSLQQAMQDMPELAELSRHVLIEQTPEGLRIQLVDQEGRSMFRAGAAEPNDRAIVLLKSPATCQTACRSQATPTLDRHPRPPIPIGTCRRIAPMRHGVFCRKPDCAMIASPRSRARPARNLCSRMIPIWLATAESRLRCCAKRLSCRPVTASSHELHIGSHLTKISACKRGESR